MKNKEIEEKILSIEKRLDNIESRFNKLVTDIVYLSFDGPKPDRVNGESYKDWVSKFSGGVIDDRKKKSKVSSSSKA